MEFTKISTKQLDIFVGNWLAKIPAVKRKEFIKIILPKLLQIRKTYELGERKDVHHKYNG